MLDMVSHTHVFMEINTEGEDQLSMEKHVSKLQSLRNKYYEND